MNTIRFDENEKLIKSFMDRLWAILPAGWSPELRGHRKDDCIELRLRNYNDHTYAKRYLRNVSYRPPEEIMFDVTTWAIRYIVEKYSARYITEKYSDEKKPRITKVIFNDPATIVFWADDTKTVVKSDNKERYDPEKGLAMAISKKALGNQGNYYNEFRKWIVTEDQNEEPKVYINPDWADDLSKIIKYCTYGGDNK